MLWTGNINKIFNKAISYGCKTVVMKLGEKGCLIGQKNKVIKVPAFKTKVVNPTGAGDLFDAGFIFSFLRGDCVEKAGKFGNLVASFGISRFGDCRYPTMEQLKVG